MNHNKIIGRRLSFQIPFCYTFSFCSPRALFNFSMRRFQKMCRFLLHFHIVLFNIFLFFALCSTDSSFVSTSLSGLLSHAIIYCINALVSRPSIIHLLRLHLWNSLLLFFWHFPLRWDLFLPVSLWSWNKFLLAFTGQVFSCLSCPSCSDTWNVSFS